jgi:hypothetical protein
MKTKRSLTTLLLVLMSIPFAFAQFTGPVGEPDAAEIGIDSAQQSLREVSVTKFEDAGFWFSSMPGDQGITVIRRLPGGSLDKVPITGEAEVNIEEPDIYVVGMKVQYFRRGLNTFSLSPVRPLPVAGITKTLSVWVVGRNMSHTLRLTIDDFFGNRAVLTMGKLNFSGWKQMTVAVPPSIKQRDFHYNDRSGIKVVGFTIETDPLEAFGTYYVYFDDMRAVTDLFAAESRDADNMADVW